MSAYDELRNGNLREALAQLQGEVRRDPGNAAHRIFLFQLLCVLGDWDRALGQLGVAGDLDPRALAMVQTYREALRCEVFRAEVFAGRRSPLVFGKPAAWVAWMIEALRRSKRDDLIALTRRHLKPAPQAYIEAYRLRFGDGTEL